MSAWAVTIPVKKLDAIEGLVTGWASVVTDDNGIPIIDSQGDVIPAHELEKAAQAAFRDLGGAGRAGDMHERTGVADIVESFVLTREKRAALGLGDGPEGWIVTLKVTDPNLLKEITDGEKLELSIHGEAVREEIEQRRAA